MNNPVQADVRVYLVTYRRHEMLRRALESLLNQTHSNWICELHNDDPTDVFPEQLVRDCKDTRIKYVAHERNLGAVETFNQAFKPVEESYVSILEDDNWWEPDFLATMLRKMDEHADVKIAWANMWFARELADGTWRQEGTIWPITSAGMTQIFNPPDVRQVCGALHSNGAMLVRVCPSTMFEVPKSLPFFAIEPVRERAYPGPLLLISRPLAHFALTRATSRGETADQNMQTLVLLAQTFFAHAHPSREFCRGAWMAHSGSLGHKQRALLVGAILAGQFWNMFRAAKIRDLALVAAWALRHPLRFCELFHARQAYPEVFAFLDAAGRSRAKEWNSNGNHSTL